MTSIARRVAALAATASLAVAAAISSAAPAAAAELAVVGWRILPQPDLRVLAYIDVDCHPGYDGKLDFVLEGQHFFSQAFTCPSRGRITLSGVKTYGIVVNGMTFGSLNNHLSVRMEFDLTQKYVFSTGQVRNKTLGPLVWPPAAAAPASATAIADYRVRVVSASQIEASIDVDCFPGLPYTMRFDFEGEPFLSRSFVCPASGRITFTGTRPNDDDLRPGRIVMLEFRLELQSIVIGSFDAFRIHYLLQ